MRFAGLRSFVLCCACVVSVACGSVGSDECDDLCEHAPTATPDEGGCVSDFVTDLGYNTGHPDCVVLADAFVRGTATVAMCAACYESIGVSASDCAAAERACFDSDSSSDASPGAFDAAPGTPDAAVTADATPGDVDTCDELCDLTPGATPTEGGCSSDTVELLGYDTNNIPCGILAASFAAGTATTAECDACYGAIGITDAHCTAVYTTCF